MSVLSALRRPEAARGLLLWSASGGPYSCQFLGFNYHVPYIMAAQAAGMAAVAETPFFAERIAARSANRERLLALDPEEFVRAMHRWNRAFYYSPEATLAGVADSDLGKLALPIYTYDYDDASGSWEGFSGLLVMQVDTEAADGENLVELGRIDHDELVAESRCLYEDYGGCGDYYWYSTMRRGVMIEDSLYSISSYGVKVNELLDPGSEIARVLFWPATR